MYHCSYAFEISVRRRPLQTMLCMDDATLESKLRELNMCWPGAVQVRRVPICAAVGNLGWSLGATPDYLLEAVYRLPLDQRVTLSDKL